MRAIVAQLTERHNQNWKFHEYRFWVRFVDTFGTDLEEIQQVLRRTFVDIMTKMRDKADSDYHSWVQISMYSPDFVELEFPFVSLDDPEIVAEQFEAAIMRRMESAKRFKISKGFEIRAVLQQTPHGGEGPIKKALAKEVGKIKFCAAQRTIIDLPRKVDSGLCLPAQLFMCHFLARLAAKGCKNPASAIVRREKPIIVAAKAYLVRAGLQPGNLVPQEIEEIAKANFDLVNCHISVFNIEGVRIYNRDGHGDVGINLLLYKRHYFGIRSLSAFFKTKNACQKCGRGYKAKYHKCAAAGCGLCKNFTCQNREKVLNGGGAECIVCGIFFRTEDCERAHQCGQRKRCSTCRQVAPAENFNKVSGKHKDCGQWYCKRCTKVVASSEKHDFCFVTKYKFKKEEFVSEAAYDAYQLKAGIEEEEEGSANAGKEYRPIVTSYFDIETITLETGLMIPVLVVVLHGDANGPEEYWREADDNNRDACYVWIRALLKMLSDDSGKNVRRHILSHNGARFDTIAVTRALIQHKVEIDTVCVGRKLLQVRLKRYNVLFADTYAYAPLSLRKLSAALEVPQKKTYFPYSLLTIEWENAVFDWPEESSWAVENMSKSQYASFSEWYKEEKAKKKDRFDWKENLAEYCKIDVMVLAACGEMLIDLMAELTEGRHMVASSSTLPSFLFKLFRSDYLKPDRVPILPEMGFLSGGRSKFGDAYLSWIVKKYKVENLEREYRIENFKIDGFINRLEASELLNHKLLKHVKMGSRLALEVNGCIYHGCSRCFEPDLINPITKRRNSYMVADNESRLRRIGECIDGFAVTIPTCYIEEEILVDAELRKFMAAVDVVSPMRGRDPLFGGFVNTFRTYYECEEDETVDYLDIVSMYPLINATAEYPVGEPKCRLYPSIESVELLKSADDRQLSSPKLGVYKAKFVPPKNLFVPVLPLRTGDGRLVYTLCATCAEERQTNEMCGHDDDERAIISCFTDAEMRDGLENGYELRTIYEAWEFDESDNELFKGYIRKFFIEKLKASGIPEDFVGDPQRYVKEINAQYECTLSTNDFVYNSSKRLMTKLMVNCIWGRFSVRCDASKTVVINRYEDLVKIFTTGENTVLGLNEFEESTFLITYKKNDIFCKVTAPNSSLLVGIFTTSNARRFLMANVARIPPQNLIYCDTDSVVYKRGKTECVPRGIPLGHKMGEFQHEKMSGKIYKWVSTGAKCYVAFWKDPETGQEGEEIKCKGFTISREAPEIQGKDMVAIVTGEKTCHQQENVLNITRDMLRMSLHNKGDGMKKLSFTANRKRYIDMSTDELKYCTFPFGFCANKDRF